MTALKIVKRYDNPEQVAESKRPVYIVQPELRLLSKKEVCKRLGIGLTALQSRIDKGEFDTLKLGRETKIISDSVDRFINKYRNMEA